LIVDQTNRLYGYITRVVKSDTKRKKSEAMMLYKIFESLYCALEELSYPCPKGFSTNFVALGKQCLPRSVFLQYIERDVFTLDVNFVEKTVAELDDTEEDRLFKYELLSNLNNRTRSLQIMTAHYEYVDYLLQFYLSNLPLRAPTKEELNGPANLEATNESFFIPRSVFLNAIRASYDNDSHREIVAFIDQYDERLHTTVIRKALLKQNSEQTESENPTQ